MTAPPPGILAAALAAGLLSLLVPGGGEGQEIRLVPHAGLHVPATDHGEARDGPDGRVELGRKSATLALGVAGELDPPRLPVGLRATLVHSTDSPVSWVSAQGRPDRTRGSLLVLTGAAVIRPIPRLLAAEPYLLAGGGLRRFGFETADPAVEGVLRDQTRGAVHLGGGVDVMLGSLSAVVEVAGVVGRFEPGGEPPGDRRTMTDVFLTVGLALGR